MTTAAPEVTRIDRLEPGQISDLLALAQAADRADGAHPLSEHVMLRLRSEDPAPVDHLVLRDRTGVPVGYAQLDRTGDPAGAEAELAVHPQHRRQGLGRALVDAAVARSGGADLRIWAHGDHPSAAALALDLGFTRERVLWQFRRPLGGTSTGPVLPAGVVLRAFQPGQDDEAWLAVNRRAFAEHPEQGRWTAADLTVRMAEPWFDPAGFLLAVEESTGRLLGFHWTKVHAQPGPADAHGQRDAAVPGEIRHEPMGEVYVVGVDPEAHGLGLGKALTWAGLRHLGDRGLTRVMLYVDESNVAAVALYTRLGFSRWTTHVQYRHTA
ncbi:mycothiol synthase [Micromonospora pisi]|uniref:Mycothiol acetyltransferase n=1 Tax=Micromonospora pisi TaxID=589240 RepID=A0A495JIS7_9ACTN|nr:mycothiol synthase [Micromonospora pisi]RKR88833.1 mycothiol synthase [Micromonospora pisi]